MTTKALGLTGLAGLAGLAGSLALTCASDGGFTGVTLTTHIPQANGRTTYRIYANFDDPTDQLLAVSGTANRSLRFETNTVLINNGGQFNGTKFEDFAGFPLSGIDDTYLSIGTTMFAGNDTDYCPGFLNNDGVTRVVSGSQWSDDNDGWFDGNALDTPSTGTIILIAQFTVADESDGTPGKFELDGNVSWRDGGEGDAIVTPFLCCNVGDPDPCRWDFNGDYMVGIEDLLALLDDWGPCAFYCQTDLDEDGIVGFLDLLELLARWDSCTP